MTWRTFLADATPDTMFDVAVHVAWADGRLCPSEVIAIKGLATLLDLGMQDLGRALLARQGRALEPRALAELSPLERPLAYAVAAWVAGADGRTTGREWEALHELAMMLGLEGSLVLAIDARLTTRRLGVLTVSDHARAIDGVLASCLEEALRSPAERTAPLASEARRALAKSA